MSIHPTSLPSLTCSSVLHTQKAALASSWDMYLSPRPEPEPDAGRGDAHIGSEASENFMLPLAVFGASPWTVSLTGVRSPFEARNPAGWTRYRDPEGKGYCFPSNARPDLSAARVSERSHCWASPPCWCLAGSAGSG